MNNLKMYKRFILIYIKCKMEYRLSFLMYIIMPIISYTCNYISIWLVVNKFHSIGGWKIYDIMFLYSLNLLSYGLSGMFIFAPMFTLEDYINQGIFDGILTKPLNPLIHLIYRQFNHLFLGHVILSSMALIFISLKLNILWTLNTIVMFIIVLIGATLIQTSIMIMAGSLSFWFLNSSSMAYSIINMVRAFIDYPIHIYNKFIQILLTFILPYAFISFYPTRYFLNKVDSGIFNPNFVLITPIVGVIMLTSSYRIWTCGIHRYESSGS